VQRIIYVTNIQHFKHKTKNRILFFNLSFRFTFNFYYCLFRFVIRVFGNVSLGLQIRASELNEVKSERAGCAGKSEVGLYGENRVSGK